MLKHIAISRTLKEAGISEIVRAGNLEEGIQKIEAEASWKAGELVFEKLWEKEIEIPVIVCSSMNMKVSGAFGCVWYSELRDWKKELTGLVNKIC